MDIFDAKGQKVNTINKTILSAFEGELDWGGADTFGSPVSIGTYYFKLKLDNLIAKQTFLEGRTIKIK